MVSCVRGIVVALDGPSGAGKSTIARRLLAHPDLDLNLVKRYTTRKPRPGDSEEENYIFVENEVFRYMENRGQFIEARAFKFGMSYGTPVKETQAIVESGHNAFTIISLGNIGKVRRYYPNATGIFVNAPLKDIEGRLQARGLRQEQINERLGNAKSSRSYTHMYNCVVHNENGKLDEVTDLVVEFLSRAISNFTK